MHSTSLICQVCLSVCLFVFVTSSNKNEVQPYSIHQDSIHQGHDSISKDCAKLTEKKRAFGPVIYQNGLIIELLDLQEDRL